MSLGENVVLIFQLFKNRKDALDRRLHLLIGFERGAILLVELGRPKRDAGIARGGGRLGSTRWGFDSRAATLRTVAGGRLRCRTRHGLSWRGEGSGGSR